MARTEDADQSSSACKSTEADCKPEETGQETVQQYSADPSVTKMLQFTASGSNRLSDPAMEEHFRAVSDLGLRVANFSKTYDTGNTTSDVKSSVSSAGPTCADVPGTEGAEKEERKPSSNHPTKLEGRPLTKKR